jgi:regulator of sigma E protease
LGDDDLEKPVSPDLLASLSQQERAQSYIGQPVGRRIVVAAAGPAANLIFAFFLFSGLTYFLGRPTFPPVINEVVVGSPAAHAGLEKDDLIVSVDGKDVIDLFQVKAMILDSKGQPMNLVVRRKDALLDLRLTPVEETEEDEFTHEKVTKHVIGIKTMLNPKEAYKPVGIIQSIAYGFADTWEQIALTYTFLGKFISGESKDIAGPIGIAQISHKVVEKGGSYWYIGLLRLVAVLSISIGLLNLLPIPLLDGGHILFYIIEAVRGVPLSMRMQEFGWRIGFALVGLLLLTATWHDFVRLGILKYLPFSR